MSKNRNKKSLVISAKDSLSGNLIALVVQNYAFVLGVETVWSFSTKNGNLLSVTVLFSCCNTVYGVKLPGVVLYYAAYNKVIFATTCMLFDAALLGCVILV